MTSVLFNTHEYYQPSYHVDCIISPVFMASVLLNTHSVTSPILMSTVLSAQSVFMASVLFNIHGYYQLNTHVDGIIRPVSIHGLCVI